MKTPYIPGRETGYSPVRVPENTGQYPRLTGRIVTKMRLSSDPRWGARGILAVAAVLALCILMDGAVLMFLARWQ